MTLSTSSTYQAFKDRVRTAADIVEVVGEVVVLKRAGRSLTGLCPFHQEKTPSFHVDPAKGVYYCFGCGAGGDAFKFVMQLHGVDFSEALGLLAERYRIERPAFRPDAEGAGDGQRRRRVLEALESAQTFFASTLDTAAGEKGRRYLSTRGLTLEQARSFGIGLAPPGWEGVMSHLAARGFTVDEIVDSGLAVPRQEGKGAYDRFRDRLMFPIRDTAGRVVSFGGRAFGDEDPKYLNGPETSVYDKGRTLFRLYEAAAQIRQTGRAVVVEGYFDAVGLAAAGVGGVVAVCGTAFGPAHARLLRRWTERVVLLFDGDAAGRRAVQRAVPALLEERLGLRVAVLEDGQDPDDLARTGGQAAVDACLKNAEDLPDYLCREAQRSFDLSATDGRVAALEMVLGHLSVLASPLARAEAASKVSERLGIADRLVQDELQRAARERRRNLRAAAVAAPPGRRLSGAEELLIRALCHAGDQLPEDVDRFVAEIPLQALGADGRTIVDHWIATWREAGERLDLPRLADEVEDPLRGDLLRLSFAAGDPPTLDEGRGALKAFHVAALQDRMRDVQRRIETTADATEKDRLLMEKVLLAREFDQLHRAVM